MKNHLSVLLLFVLLCGVLLIFRFPPVLAVVYAAPSAWLLVWCARCALAGFQWVRDHTDGMLRFFQILAALALFVLSRLALHLPWIVSVLMPLLVFFASRRLFLKEQHKEEDANLTVTVIHPDGRFQNVSVTYREGDSVWCASLDGKGKVLAYRPVTVREGAGYVSAEDGMEKVKLYRWDGGEGTPELLAEAAFGEQKEEDA